MIVVAAALLAGVGPPAPEAARGQAVRVSWDARTRACATQVAGADLGDPETDAGQDALVRALPDHGVRVQVRGIDDAPYRCIVAVADTLRRAGYPSPAIGSRSPLAGQ